MTLHRLSIVELILDDRFDYECSRWMDFYYDVSYFFRMLFNFPLLLIIVESICAIQ